MNKPYIINLNDDELDSVVGGAFNQNVAAQYDLKVKTASSGAQFVRIKACIGSKTSNGFDFFETQGSCSEGRLGEICNDRNLQSLEIQNNKREWVSFSKEQCNALLKG